MRILLVFWVIFISTIAAAEDARLRSLDSLDEGREWDAIGRLEIGGKGFCTGTLIEPALVLTAAHCLFDRETGERLSTGDIQFLAGWRNGRASAYRRVRNAVVHPDYDYDGEADTGRVRNDLALIELQHPVNNTTVLPFDTDIRPGSGDQVAVVSYAHDRPDAPSIQEVCEVLSRQQGVLVMSCDVDFGSSGAPVFSHGGGPPRIVSVISAKAEALGRPVSLGTALDGPLDVLRVELSALRGLVHSSAPGLERLKPGMRKDIGAKFIRP